MIDPVNKVVALPASTKGSIRVLRYIDETSIGNVIQAHETDLGAISVNSDGTLIASASCRGTVIKIFNAIGGETL